MLVQTLFVMLSQANQRSTPEGAKVKHLYFRTVQRFFTFVQNDKFACCIDLWVNCYIIAFIYEGQADPAPTIHIIVKCIKSEVQGLRSPINRSLLLRK